MGLFSWLLPSNRLTDSVQRGRPGRRTAGNRSARRFRPRLELLEDRQVLSTLYVDLDWQPNERRIRHAIERANSDPSIDVIELNNYVPEDPIRILDDPLTITSLNLKIVAKIDQRFDSLPGALSLQRVERLSPLGTETKSFSLFVIAEGSNVTLQNLTIGPNPRGDNDVYDDNPDQLGAWITNHGTLTVNSSTIRGRQLGSYPGIYNSGTLTVNTSDINGTDGILNTGILTVNSSVIDRNLFGIYSSGTLTIHGSNIENSGYGGIINSGTLMVNSSAFTGNMTNLNGGAIWNSGTATVVASAFIGNSANIGGGGIWNTGTATVISSLLSGNLAAQGGGIYSTGPMTVTASSVADNFALDGAGIYSQGPLTVTASTLSNNVASFQGGGIFSAGLTTLTASTLRDNLATDGGGIWNTGALEVTSSTLSGNTADYTGGGIANDDGTVSVISSTFSGNSAVEGGGISSNQTATLTHTIVANSPAGGDIAGTIAGGYNLVEDGSGGLAGTITGDPLLGALADNGGPTKTHALLPGSLAVDAGANILIPAGLTTDQRGSGYPRVRRGAIDIGAFENHSLPPTALADAIATAEDTAVHVFVRDNDSDPDNDPLTLVAITQPNHGAAAINSNGTVTYTPFANFHGTDSFTYTVSDGHEGAATATVSVTVTAVNDAPALVLPGAQSTTADMAVRITGIAVADVDVNEGTGEVKVTLTVASGRLSASTSAAGGLTAAQVFGNGTATVVLRGSIAAVNATLRAGISYLGNLNFHGNDALSITANDLNNFGAGGALTASGDVAIHVASPAEQIDDLQDRVRVLRELGSLTQATARTLLMKLNHANQALAEGKTKVAYNLIGAFLNQVQDLIDRGLLTPAAAPLLTLSRRLRESLQIGGGF